MAAFLGMGRKKEIFCSFAQVMLYCDSQSFEHYQDIVKEYPNMLEGIDRDAYIKSNRRHFTAIQYIYQTSYNFYPEQAINTKKVAKLQREF